MHKVRCSSDNDKKGPAHRNSIFKANLDPFVVIYSNSSSGHNVPGTTTTAAVIIIATIATASSSVHPIIIAALDSPLRIA